MDNYVTIHEYESLMDVLIINHPSKTKESFQKDWDDAKSIVRKHEFGKSWGLQDIYSELRNMGWSLVILDCTDILF